MNDKRRIFGEHLTPVEIFREFILPEIRNKIYDYLWVDLFGGEGNLILPILEIIPEKNRIEFFEKHIFLFDIQEELVEKAVKNASEYGIPKEIARKNITQRDCIENYPTFLFDRGYPIYHITNPPYLYIGYIVKNNETQKFLKYFNGKNTGYQDLYQLCLINDLRNRIRDMIYIIPSNFLFGASVSNKIRKDFFPYYIIKRAIIFEKEIFEYTGTNVAICFFQRKETPKIENVFFEGIKINKSEQKKKYNLKPENQYRAGDIFEEFLASNISSRKFKIKYYLTKEEIEENKGDNEIEVLDVNNFNNGKYGKTKIFLNDVLLDKIKSNTLFIRTVDTGTSEGRAGLYFIDDVFGVSGILVTTAKYRTHPIQIFIEPILSIDEQGLLKDYFNLILEFFRRKTDSEFMTSYKYSDSGYTRKYLGLSQAKKIIETFPLSALTANERANFIELIEKKDAEALIVFMSRINKKKELSLCH